MEKNSCSLKLANEKPNHSHFGNGLSFYCSILDEICQEEDIKIQWLSNNWLALLEKNGQHKFIMGHKFDINSAIAAAIADDKYATFDVLRQAKIPVIEHALLYEPGDLERHAENHNSLDYVETYLAEHDNHIVIKPNNGARGINVFQIITPDQIPPVLKKIFHQSYSASMCPFYDILREFRVILLDNEARLVYDKVRGKDWRFNLQQGARAVDVEDEGLRRYLVELAQRAARALGLRFCSVDIIETAEHERLVMEINSGVMTEHYLEQHPDKYDKVKHIYRDAVRAMFRP